MNRESDESTGKIPEVDGAGRHRAQETLEVKAGEEPPRGGIDNRVAAGEWSWWKKRAPTVFETD